MRSTASFGSARKAKLLRPDAFTVRHVERLRSMKRPGFETLQQQNPCARDRLHIRAEHSGVFIPAMVPPDGPVVLSIDPEQKGGPMHSNSVDSGLGPPRQAGTCCSIYGVGKHDMPIFAIKFGASKDDFAQVQSNDRPRAGAHLRYRGEQGLWIEPITPHEDKVTRLHRHQCYPQRHRSAARGGPMGHRIYRRGGPVPVRPFRRPDRRHDAVSGLDRRASAPRQAAASGARRCDQLKRRAPTAFVRASDGAMPGRSLCPRSSTLVTVENSSVQNGRRSQEYWPRREPSMCNFLVDAALPPKYQANRHVENVTRALSRFSACETKLTA